MEPAALSALTVDHLARDKKQPAEEGDRRSLIERADFLGHLGETAIFKKKYGTTVTRGERWRMTLRTVYRAACFVNATTSEKRVFIPCKQ